MALSTGEALAWAVRRSSSVWASFGWSIKNIIISRMVWRSAFALDTLSKLVYTIYNVKQIVANAKEAT